MRQVGFLLLGMALLQGLASGRDFQLSVESGRDHPVVLAAPAPADFPAAGFLRSGAVEIPFQKNNSGEVIFVLPAGLGSEPRVFTVVPGTPPSLARAAEENGAVTVSTDGRKRFTYHSRESALPRADIPPVYRRGGYFHPVWTPAGRIVSDDFPPNHVHHHGIWAAWTKTEFEGRHPDFWNMGEGKGKVEAVRLGSHWSGPVHAGFSAEHRHVDSTVQPARIALEETWNVTAYSIPGAAYAVFDLISTQRCAGASALRLPKYHYGGFGFRGNRAWDGAANCRFLTSSGETRRVEGNETRGDWCYIGGAVEGAPAGLAILGHPQNFRAPQPMRLHPTEPFFCYAPSQLGDWSIEPGQAYVSRYRFIVLDGPPDLAQLQALHALYAAPPKVSVLEK